VRITTVEAWIRAAMQKSQQSIGVIEDLMGLVITLITVSFPTVG
jgi:hypothetical protein